MTEEERRIISAFVERMAGVAQAQPAASPWGGSSVPAVQSRAALPPVDPEADRLIGDLFTRYPDARYRLTQTAFVQEHALVQAQNRIQELEWQLENSQQQAQAAPQRSGGLLGGLFGGGGQQQRPQPMSPRPQPMQPPMGQMPQGMQQGRGGSGFLGSALTTAAGVAGGMVMGNMLMGMFSGGAAQAATTAATDAAGAAGDFAQEAVPGAASPWTDPAADAGYSDASPVSDGGWGNDAAADGGFDDAGYGDDDI